MPAWRARCWFLATAACALAGVTLSVVTAAGNHGGHFASPVARAFNTFAFFTIGSNLLVAGTCGSLALRPERRGALLSALRLSGLGAITVTGVVFHLALGRLLDLDGLDWFANQLVHTAVPVLAVAGFLLFGPWGGASWRVLVASVALPAGWLLFTLARGAAIGWYPYPFLDVTALGYPKAALNACWVALLLLGLSAGFAAAGRRLARPQPPGAAEPGQG